MRIGRGRRQLDSGEMSNKSADSRLLFSVQREVARLEAERERLRLEAQRASRRRDANGRHVARERALVESSVKSFRALYARAQLPRNVSLFDTWTLAETFDHCCADECEGLCVIAGCDVLHVRVGMHMIPLDCGGERSAVYARAKDEEIARVAYEIADSGHRIAALIHSHPGVGPDANHPSREDRRTQRNWEAQTHLVSGIWSRDGYLRFFTDDKPFDIQVVGASVEQLEPGLYRFDMESDL